MISEIPGSTLSTCPLRCLISVISHSFVHMCESFLHSKQIDLVSPLPSREQCSNFSFKHTCFSTVIIWPFFFIFLSESQSSRHTESPATPRGSVSCAQFPLGMESPSPSLRARVHSPALWCSFMRPPPSLCSSFLSKRL